MALMTCPSCNQRVSDKNAKCPNCRFGFSGQDGLSLEQALRRFRKKNMFRWQKFSYFALTLFIGGFIWIWLESKEAQVSQNPYSLGLAGFGAIIYTFIRIRMMFLKR